MPEVGREKLDPVFYVLAAVLLWSTGGLFIKLTTLDPYQITFFRSLLAGITVLLLTRSSGLRINGFGLIVSCIYATLLFLFVWATKQTTAANAIFLQYTAPVYILIFAPFVIGEKFRLRDLLTVFFCICGMSLFFIGDLSIGDYQGNIAALGSGVFLGLYIMLLKHPRITGLQSTGTRAPHTGRVSPIATVVYGNLILALVTLPAGIPSIPRLTSVDILAVSFLGIVQIGISYVLFIKGVAGGTRPLDASIIGFIEPLLNPVWVLVFIGETPSRWAVLGGTIIIATVGVHTVAQYHSGYKER
jgi:drug/metabolite transporter, DME family